jgi:hypothetical protein
MPLPVVGKAHEAGAGSGPFRWFIYGSSLDGDAFRRWAAEHGYRVPDFSAAVPARLEGWRLAFDVASRFWGGAVASLVEESGRSVEGVALPLPAEARGLVDHKEGAISGLYEPFETEAVPLGGGDRLRVLAYRAAPARRLPSEQAPAPAFLEALIKGAREQHLSAAWVSSLEALRGR